MPRKKQKARTQIKIKKTNSLQWIFEPIEQRIDFIQKKMFGCEAAYFNDRLVLVLADSGEPWNGLLVPTERKFHPSIQKEFPDLTPHPILGKWLYFSQSGENFEVVAIKIVEYLQSGDPRFGVNPKPKKVKSR
jgi:hypothetical protein